MCEQKKKVDECKEKVKKLALHKSQWFLSLVHAILSNITSFRVDHADNFFNLDAHIFNRLCFSAYYSLQLGNKFAAQTHFCN